MVKLKDIRDAYLKTVYEVSDAYLLALEEYARAKGEIDNKDKRQIRAVEIAYFIISNVN